jgi:hypothetical protein
MTGIQIALDLLVALRLEVRQTELARAAAANCYYLEVDYAEDRSGIV